MIGLILGVFFCNSSFALNYSITEGQINFDAVGNPKKLLIHGKTEQMTGQLVLEKKIITAQTAIDLSSFTTGMALRDQHMKNKYLEVEKFKEATLKINPISVLSESTPFKLSNVKFDGMLKLHGVEKPISGTASIDSTNGMMAVDASFSVNTEDYKISTPSFAGLTVANNVDIKVKFVAKPDANAKQ